MEQVRADEVEVEVEDEVEDEASRHLGTLVSSLPSNLAWLLWVSRESTSSIESSRCALIAVLWTYQMYTCSLVNPGEPRIKVPYRLIVTQMAIMALPEPKENAAWRDWCDESESTVEDDRGRNLS